METVEVVIRIPKRTYDRVSERGIIAYGDDAYYIGHAIENGTVLPKGHGRLIDNNKIRFVDEEFEDGRTYMIAHVTDIDNTPTVIEADKEVQDEK